MELGTTWGHPVHEYPHACAHPVHAETRQKTSPKPLVPLAETGIELRHRRARRRASRRRLRTAGSWETSRPSGPARSTAGSVQQDGGPPRGNLGTAAQRETAATTGTTRSGAGAEHDGGPPGGDSGRRRSGRPRRRRVRASARQSRKAKQVRGATRAGGAGDRADGAQAHSHLDSTEHDHRARGGRPPTTAQRETAAATGPGREFGARRRRTSGHRGNPTAAQRETAVLTGLADATAVADAIGGPAGATWQRREARATAGRDEVRRTHGSTEGRPRGRGNPAAGRPDVQRGAPRSHTSRGPAPCSSLPSAAAAARERHDLSRCGLAHAAGARVRAPALRRTVPA